MTQMIINGAGELRVVSLHPSFFKLGVKLSVGKRAHDLAHDTMPMIEDIVIRRGSHIFYEKHYPRPQVQMKVVSGRTTGQKEVLKLYRKEHRNKKLHRVEKLTDISW